MNGALGEHALPNSPKRKVGRFRRNRRFIIGNYQATGGALGEHALPALKESDTKPSVVRRTA